MGGGDGGWAAALVVASVSDDEGGGTITGAGFSSFAMSARRSAAMEAYCGEAVCVYVCVCVLLLVSSWNKLTCAMTCV